MEEINRLLSTLDLFRILSHAAALAFAYVLALPIGWDREQEERSAGLRTFPPVALASCSFYQFSMISTHVPTHAVRWP